jgi:hypothetical protein
MLHEKPDQCDRPDGTGIDADAGSGEWPGEKMPKHLVPSLHSEVRTSSSSDSPPAEGDQQDILFTEHATISLDKVIAITTSMKDKP